MSRPLRLEYPGAWWHVTNRGVEKRDIFLDPDDRRGFLHLLAEAVAEFRWRLHTYVLMNNHFHLLVETPEPTLSVGVKKVEERYAVAFNKKRARVGHLFQGRFKSHLVDCETYLLNVARYIVLNPVRAKFTRTAADWPWSSFRAIAGLKAGPPWLTTTAILDRFEPGDSIKACNEYRRFVGDANAAAERPWDQLVGGLCLGSPEFVERVHERIHGSGETFFRRASLDQVRQTVLAVTGGTLAKSGSPGTRLAFAELARSETDAPLKEIGVALGVSVTGVGYLIRQSKQRGKTDRDFAELIHSLRLQIRNCKLRV